MKKKILALLMCAVMVIGILPVYAFALGETQISSDGLWQYTDIDGSESGVSFVKITAYLGESDTLIIPAVIDGKFVKTVDSSVFVNSTVKTAFLSQGIQVIYNVVYSEKLSTRISDNKLETIIIPDSVIAVGRYTFAFTDHLKEIIVSSYNPAYTSENGVLYSKDKSTLIKYPPQKQDSEFTVPDTVTEISNYAFAKCSYLRKVTLGENVRTNGSYFLFACPLLEEVNLNEGLEYLFEYSLYECDSLKSLKIPDSVLRLNSYTAAYCDELKSVEIGTGCISVLDGSFFNSLSLERAVISNPDTTIQGGGFFGKTPFRNCSKLTIYGYIDSTAQTFAENNRHRFKYLDDVAGGDLNNDGITGIDDYAELKELLSGNASFTNFKKAVSDINGDGAVDAFDLFEIDRVINAQ